MADIKDKLQQFIQKTTLEQMKQQVGTAAKMNVPPPGQPALEGEIVRGDDVRTLEAMRTSVYDPDRTGVVNEARLLEGLTAEEIKFDLRLQFLMGG